MMTSQHAERLQRARLSLEGLSVGDALGGFFEFNQPAVLDRVLKTRMMPDIQWHFTDDTNMALSIYEILRLHEHIEQQALATSFALNFDRGRGYGPSIHRFVPRVLSVSLGGKLHRELLEVKVRLAMVARCGLPPLAHILRMIWTR
jgi:ADP-ribosylglycohydrolase